MQITQEQFERIAGCLPRQRGNVTQDNLQVINALLYVAEHGCKWRGLPREFGNWHSIYTRMNRWSKNGTLTKVFERLQEERLIAIKIEAVSMDSTTVKVHPDGTGALKNRAAIYRQVQGRLDNQDSSGRRDCRVPDSLQSVTGQRG